MRRALLCAGLAAAMWPSSAGAQSLSLSEAEALSRLSPDSPRIRALRAGVEVARADILAAGRLPNPRISVERQAVAGVTEYYTSVSQVLPITGRRGLEVQAATALASARAGGRGRCRRFRPAPCRTGGSRSRERARHRLDRPSTSGGRARRLLRLL